MTTHRDTDPARHQRLTRRQREALATVRAYRQWLREGGHPPRMPARPTPRDFKIVARLEGTDNE